MVNALKPSIESSVSFVKDNRLKLLKYCGVAAIGVPIGLFVYALFLWGTDWNAAWANFAATLVMVGPNYVMNRYWVWAKNDTNRLWGEIVPFAVMALIGLVVSTIAAGVAESLGAGSVMLLIVNLLSFGVVWVGKFFVLDKFLFGHHPTAV